MCDEEDDSRKYSSSDNSSYQSVPDADREMAVQAFRNLRSKNIMKELKKLLSNRPQDAKVLHNYAVVEYFLSDSLRVIGFVESVLFADKNCNKSSQKEEDVRKEENNDNGISDVLKRKLQLCKARSYAMMKTAKGCKREIKNLLPSGSSVPNIPAYYLKCQLEHQ
ncbi:hypothetical protein AVEN_31322-1 [Araneus ventricosus]|uniref:CCR4-NOT transcription complex subunit 10 n=1 Tax=Araneus ventricosus TaxID=182803 RepID=A0A4Y2S9Q0_ARAVE|nr:hypothetical protein AVEN_31322-1 [Araneus ventricosus]